MADPKTKPATPPMGSWSASAKKPAAEAAPAKPAEPKKG